jgi:hypothetical protein
VFSLVYIADGKCVGETEDNLGQRFANHRAVELHGRFLISSAAGEIWPKTTTRLDKSPSGIFAP